MLFPACYRNNHVQQQRRGHPRLPVPTSFFDFDVVVLGGSGANAPIGPSTVTRTGGSSQGGSTGSVGGGSGGAGGGGSSGGGGGGY